jgi:hypothetical protein
LIKERGHGRSHRDSLLRAPVQSLYFPDNFEARPDGLEDARGRPV